MAVSPTLVKIRSYHMNISSSTNASTGNTNNSGPTLQTVMSISAHDFETFNFVETNDKSEVELVFGLKEIKSILGFCEATETPTLNIYFHDNGLPILLSVDAPRCVRDARFATSTPSHVPGAALSAACPL